jgi:fluoride exporter
MQVLLVGIGGGLGSMARYLVGVAVMSAWPSASPLATAIVNISGCAVIGALAALLEHRSPAMTTDVWAFAVVGFLGGYTTFSSFGLDTIRLLETNPRLGIANAVLQTVVGVAAVLASRTGVQAMLR